LVLAALVASAVVLEEGPAAAAESPLVRLAEAFAADIVRVAAGRGVELAAFEDRSTRGGTVAADLHRLVVARLGARVGTGSGPRLRVEPVVAETAERLVVSARVVAEPGGELVDLLSVSVATDPTVLPLTPARSPDGTGGIEVLSRSQTPRLGERVLALSLLGDDRLAILDEESVAVYRLQSAVVTFESRRRLPGPLDPVRSPGGLLLGGADGSLWALTSRAPRAALLAVDSTGRGLFPRAEAEAVPWPGTPRGLRFRPGTNLIEGEPQGLGPGPWLALGQAEIGVRSDGEVRLASDEGPRSSGLKAGNAVAALWPSAFVLTSPSPPEAGDSLRFVARDASSLRTVANIPVPGAVRALTARAKNGGVRLVAAVEEAARGISLLVLDLRPRAP
jgi:hypothetical protein